MNRSEKRQELKNQEKWIDEMINAQKNIMKGGDHSQMVLFLRMVVEGKMQTVPVLISNVHELTTPNEVAKRFINKYNPDTWVFINETWAKIFRDSKEAEEFRKNSKKGDVSKFPDKIDMLNILAKNRDGSIEITEQYCIIRNKDDKIINFKPFDFGEESYIKQKFLNENPKIPVNARIRRRK